MSETSQNTLQIDSGGAAGAAGTDDPGLAAAVADAFNELEQGSPANEADAEPVNESEPEEGSAESTGEEPPATDDAEVEQATEAIDAPPDFTAEEKASFAKLAPEAKSLLASYATRSQQSRSTVATELDGLKRQYGPLGETLKQYDQHLKMLGASPDQVVAGLMPYYLRLAGGDMEAKRQTIDFLARQFGVDLTAPQQEQEYVDPDLAALKSEITALKTQQMQSVQTQKQIEQQANQARMTEAQMKVDAFRDAKNDKGVLLHPHFERLEATMTALVRGGLAKTIDEAYSKAIPLDPELQQIEQKAKEEAKRKADEKKAIEAKKATSVNKKASKAPAKQNGALSARESVEEAFDELYG